MRPIYQPCGESGTDPQTLAFNNAIQSVVATAVELKEYLDLADAMLAKGHPELSIAIEALAVQEQSLIDAASRLIAADAAKVAMRAAKNAPPQPPV
jgi:CHASE3 domain sensor protein